MTQPGRTLLGAGIAALVLAADQASKFAVLNILHLPEVGDIPLLPPVLDLAMVWNHGVTFGLLQSSARGQILLGIVALAVVAGLALWLRRAETAIVASALGAIAGGALGNVVDRGRFGMVVDFIHVHWGRFDPFPYVFNVGDSAIVVGVAVLLLDSVLGTSPRLQAKPPKA